MNTDDFDLTNLTREQALVLVSKGANLEIITEKPDKSFKVENFRPKNTGGAFEGKFIVGTPVDGVEKFVIFDLSEMDGDE